MRGRRLLWRCGPVAAVFAALLTSAISDSAQAQWHQFDRGSYGPSGSAVGQRIHDARSPRSVRRVPHGMRGPGAHGRLHGIPGLIVPGFVGVLPADTIDVMPPVAQALPAEPPKRHRAAAQRSTSKAKAKAKRRRRPSRQPQQSAWNGVDGLPPAGERRFVPDHVLCVLRDGISNAEITRFLRQHRMARTAGGRQPVGLIGADLFRYRITDRRDVRTVVAALRRDPRVLFAQPDYLYTLADGNGGSAPHGAAPPQYVVEAMHLRKAHALARGEKVLVAVIDSQVDATHPELKGAIAKQIDVVGDKAKMPHAHGTAMAGAIVARSQLTGVAPAARIIAVRAFSPNSSAQASGTSFQLTRALDSAVAAGARVVNLSFAGPADPMLARAMQRAHAQGVILVAAMGNAGPQSPPLYPAADPNVIAVTATDIADRLYPDATRGAYVALAAPGVDVLVPAPHAEYGLSTGTSVAAAHVSGVVALLLARQPSLTPEAVREALRAGAKPPRSSEPAGAFGAGIVDAFQAIMALDAGRTAGREPAGAPEPALSTQ